jgi:hypothetical protein
VSTVGVGARGSLGAVFEVNGGIGTWGWCGWLEADAYEHWRDGRGKGGDI